MTTSKGVEKTVADRFKIWRAALLRNEAKKDSLSLKRKLHSISDESHSANELEKANSRYCNILIIKKNI